MGEIRTDLTNEQYHAHPAISRSMIMDFIKLPQLCWYKYINPVTKKATTPQMEYGTALHTAILEPDVFEGTYVEHPKYTGTGSRALNKDFEENALTDGKKIVTTEEINTIELMKKNFYQCEYAKEQLEKSSIEKSIFWTDEETELTLKIRPDFFTDAAAYDLKTTKSIEPYEFSKSIYDYGYHVQAAMVLDGLEAVDGIARDLFVVFAFEKEAPYCMAPFYINNEALEIGRARYHQALRDMKECFDSPVLWHMPREIGLPAWAVQKEQGSLDYVY